MLLLIPLQLAYKHLASEATPETASADGLPAVVPATGGKWDKAKARIKAFESEWAVRRAIHQANKTEHEQAATYKFTVELEAARLAEEEASKRAVALTCDMLAHYAAHADWHEPKIALQPKEAGVLNAVILSRLDRHAKMRGEMNMLKVNLAAFDVGIHDAPFWTLYCPIPSYIGFYGEDGNGKKNLEIFQ